MGRVFTIQFDFCQRSHEAMVTMIGKTSQEVSFTVRLFSDEFYHLLPTSKLCFTTTKDELSCSLQSEGGDELVDSIKEAISEYLFLSTTVHKQQ
jgi:hypothetical protein